ncbi:MAG: rhodanese-like domain-containing protein [Thermoleophilia bacterium]|nr:rhodanese-like domain-containing protein [Thermoleophilia bacterium]
MNEDSQGHIEWRNVGEPESLALLPRDQLIVVIDQQGQSAGQVTPILRMLGYDAVTLRSGMTAWTQTPESLETIQTINAADYPVVR